MKHYLNTFCLFHSLQHTPMKAKASQRCLLQPPQQALQSVSPHRPPAGLLRQTGLTTSRSHGRSFLKA